MKTIVIGSGLMGLCTAWALVERGYEVTAIERGAIPNPLSSSVDRHRVIRYPYGTSLGYCQMVDVAFAAWEKLWNALGQTHYIETGTLDLSCIPGDWAELSLDALDFVRVPYQLLDPQEMGRLYPFLSPTKLRWGLYVQRGGVLLADRIIAGLARHLLKRGAVLKPEVCAIEIDRRKRQVVLSNGEMLEADVLVVAAGAWVTKLLPQYAPRITPLRQVVAYFDPPPELATAWAAGPGILVTDGDKRFAIPPVADTGLKFAAGKCSKPDDPDNVRYTDELEARRILDYFRQWLVGIDDYRFVEAKVCYYAMSANQEFIVEEIGDRVWVVSACSGHGFKFGPAIGIALAETIAGERKPEQLTAWARGKSDL